MKTPSEKLAQSLDMLKELQGQRPGAIRSSDLSRHHRERLVANGFLQEVFKGWYIPVRPDMTPGESTAWYASFWDFCSAYLHSRFGSDWCISPEQSISLHVGNRTVPSQLLARSPKAKNNITKLPHGTSLLDMRAIVPNASDVVEKDGLRLYSVASALVTCSPNFFIANPTDTRAALAAIRDASDLLRPLLEGGHSTVAGRLAGAMRNIGRNQIADEILRTMGAAGYGVRENDPFTAAAQGILPPRERSPYVNRLILMWQQMRGPICEDYPSAPGIPIDVDDYLRRVGEVYVTDAYHSLSIEGYRVSPELIERLRGGEWNPEVHAEDRDHRNALAARGYWQAYKSVCESVQRVLRGVNPGDVAEEDHGGWYREMFAPNVTAGLLRPADLAGYRDSPVFIRQSMHVPPSREAVRDLMPVFFDLLRNEENPFVRVVLGHFMFVYIHPYVDGNGRIGRFLMNTMLAAGGYGWTVVPVGERNAYMAALEAASVRQDIVPFHQLLSRLVNEEIIKPA